MNFKRFISKNKFFIFIVLASVILFIAYKKTNEGFKIAYDKKWYGTFPGINPIINGKNFNYCTGDYEVVNAKYENTTYPICLKKCGLISPNAVVASSDPLICKKMYGTKVTSTFSRNFNSYKKLNAQGNNYGENTYTCPPNYTYNNNKCTASAIPSSNTEVNENFNEILVNGIVVRCPVLRKDVTEYQWVNRNTFAADLYVKPSINGECNSANDGRYRNLEAY